jgi:hypothetical protein
MRMSDQLLVTGGSDFVRVGRPAGAARDDRG